MIGDVVFFGFEYDVTNPGPISHYILISTKSECTSPMTRPTNPSSVEKETQLQKSLAAFRNKEKSAADATAEFNVHHRIFFDRLSETSPSQQSTWQESTFDPRRGEEVSTMNNASYNHKISSSTCYFDRNDRCNSKKTRSFKSHVECILINFEKIGS